MIRKKILIAAIVGGLLAACSGTGSEIRILRGKLAEAETAVRLSAENSKCLENTYSDIYFELDSLTVENFKAKVARGGSFYAYIGRPSCGDCNAFEPMFKRYIASHGLQKKFILSTCTACTKTSPSGRHSNSNTV